MDRGVKFFAPQNAGFFATKFDSTKFCGTEPGAHNAALRDFKFCNETLRHTRQIWQSRHPHFKFHDEKFNGANFTTCGTEFLGANFRSAELCKSKFMARDFKFYKARSRETGFLTRTVKFYGTKFHEIKLQTPNLELRMKFSEAKFRDGALLKFAAVKGLRRSPSLCAAAPFKFIALQNAGFFATKFDEAEFYGVKFHKARLRRAKFYAAEFAAKCEKFCGMKRRGAGA